MAKHTITVDEIANFEAKYQLAGSFGDGENKSLEIRSYLYYTGEIKSVFVVLNKDKVVSKYRTIEPAVKKYNSI